MLQAVLKISLQSMYCKGYSYSWKNPRHVFSQQKCETWESKSSKKKQKSFSRSEVTETGTYLIQGSDSSESQSRFGTAAE
jgi:hypothetical protein